MPVEKEAAKINESERRVHDDIHEHLLDHAIQLLDQSLNKDTQKPEQKLPPSLDHQCINNIEKFARDANKPGDVFACSDKIKKGERSTPGEIVTLR